MVNLKINGLAVTAREDTTILEAARGVGISIPTLCYWKGLNEIGACRVCVVEIKGQERLQPACQATVGEGMEVFTHSPKALTARRTNVELLLSQHDKDCDSCNRQDSCKLQSLCEELGIEHGRYEKKLPKAAWDSSFPLIRDASKCVKCMRCVQVCDRVQGVHVWEVANIGARTTVDVKNGAEIREADCALCGQCITHCPVGALSERDDTGRVLAALADSDKVAVVQVAPAIRAAWGEGLGLSPDFATEKRLVAALRRLGFDYIFDTDFAADLTVMEEGSEFLQKLQQGDALPMFTSCCPGWVRFAKTRYPEFVDRLSTAKSPQQMFGAVVKSYYADLLGVASDRIFCVSLMPCVAKKQECALPTMEGDVDVSLTTREFTRLLRSQNVDVEALQEDDFDRPLGVATGAGVIFGATGGVMEAALRSAHFLVTGKNPDPDAFKAVRGGFGWREAAFDLAGRELRVAIASGLGNAAELLDAIQSGKVHYDFVEIMACPGGCAGGGGQPICDGTEPAIERGAVLYGLDAKAKLRFSHENPEVQQCYEEFLGAPLSEAAHGLLHTDHQAWKL